MTPDTLNEDAQMTAPNQQKSKLKSLNTMPGESESCSAVPNSLQSHVLYSPRNSPGQNTGLGSLSLHQWIFPPRNQTGVICIAGRYFTNWAMRVRSTLQNQSVSQFSHSVMSDSLQPHGLQHARLPCASPTPEAYSKSRPLHWWCHPTTSSSVIPFSFSFQSLPASGSFPMSCFFRLPKNWSFSFSISPSNEHSGLISFRMDWLDLLAIQGTLKSLLQHHSSKASILQHSAFFIV